MDLDLVRDRNRDLDLGLDQDHLVLDLHLAGNLELDQIRDQEET